MAAFVRKESRGRRSPASRSWLLSSGSGTLAAPGRALAIPTTDTDGRLFRIASRNPGASHGAILAVEARPEACACEASAPAFSFWLNVLPRSRVLARGKLAPRGTGACVTARSSVAFVGLARHARSPGSPLSYRSSRWQLDAVIALALYRGLRRSEIFRLDEDSMHDDNVFVVVACDELGFPSGRCRIVPYTDQARALIAPWCRLRSGLAQRRSRGTFMPSRPHASR